jgi:hypothetical protein
MDNVFTRHWLHPPMTPSSPTEHFANAWEGYTNAWEGYDDGEPAATVEALPPVHSAVPHLAPLAR